ncbi:GGDEF domain-containing protein [Marinobacter sp.]|uniref:GGDEF domain-containing protein n=1 Tax=Marinobacter sp. TaxID=50741 RepID=UPI0025BB10A9|nr:GGDEF domain-containing protein [Marinobacter sp.]
MKNTTSVTALNRQAGKLATITQSYREWAESTSPAQRLSRKLSITLSLEEQVAILAEELAESIDYDSFSYRHRIADRDLIYVTGKGGNHRCDYRLNLEGEHYGALTLSRRTRFSEAEMQGLEMLLSVAICPIRNACRHEAIEQAALTDALTGIPNKRSLDDALQRTCSLNDRHGDPYSLILFDLDHFKAVNDQHGHVIGDHLLRETAQKLSTLLRNSDSIYRFGGEEFAIMLPHTTTEAASEVADRIRTCIREICIPCGETKVSVTGSCGVATRIAGESPDQWLARADDALYRAKDAGRDCTRCASAITG